ncbi:hypothetical protein IAU59_007040 [Kwoniella sp. CBS 9459]
MHNDSHNDLLPPSSDSEEDVRPQIGVSSPHFLHSSAPESYLRTRSDNVGVGPDGSNQSRRGSRRPPVSPARQRPRHDRDPSPSEHADARGSPTLLHVHPPRLPSSPLGASQPWTPTPAASGALIPLPPDGTRRPMIHQRRKKEEARARLQHQDCPSDTGSPTKVKHANHPQPPEIKRPSFAQLKFGYSSTSLRSTSAEFRRRTRQPLKSRQEREQACDGGRDDPEADTGIDKRYGSDPKEPIITRRKFPSSSSSSIPTLPSSPGIADTSLMDRPSQDQDWHNLPPPPPPPRTGGRPPLWTTRPADFQRGTTEIAIRPGSLMSLTAGVPSLAQANNHGRSPSSSSSSFAAAGSTNDHLKRRRGRQATACKECNRRKQKCDGDLPCATCVKRGMEAACVYPEGSDLSWNSQADNLVLSQLTIPAKKKSKRGKGRVGGSGDSIDLHHRPQSDSAMDLDETQRVPSGSSAKRIARGSSAPGLPIFPLHGSSDGGLSTLESRNEFEEVPLVPSQPNEFSYADRATALASHPVSSERNNPIPGIQSSPLRSPEASLGNRFWKSHTDVRVESEVQTKGSGSSSESDHLMEENEAHGVGSMRLHSGPWAGTKAEKTFFGTSHFGPQLAAKVIRSIPSVPLSDVRHAPSRGISRLDGVKPYTLESQTRELISYLPEREECDRYVRRFFERYNNHNDIIYQPDFLVAYHTFWNDYNTKQTSEVDLRHLSLLLIMLAFGVLLDHDPAEQGQRVDLIRSMGLSDHHFNTIGAMFQHLEGQTMSLKDREEKSSRWSWAAKRALMESSSFFGESMDTVRAGLLIALHLNVCRRVPEAWTAIGVAIRAAQAQGLHVDGSSWKGMSIKEAELRRRLWAQLYIVDRSISLFLGRPVCIQDGHFTTREPANMHDDELDMPSVFPRGINLPTKTTFLILHYRLAKIIGEVQLTCFNLNPRQYAEVQACEDKFIEFKDTLPPHFRLDREGTENSLDDTEGYRWLPTQRQTLNSKFHLARISLHRPYLLRSLGKGRGGRRENPYVASREALLFSAIADLRLRIHFNELDPLDRFKWMTVASGFNSATILGILCHLGYRDSRFAKGQLRALLQEYISLEEKTIRRDEALETELTVLKLMEAKALEREEKDRRGRTNLPGRVNPSFPSVDVMGPPPLEPGRGLQVQLHQAHYNPPSGSGSGTGGGGDRPANTLVTSSASSDSTIRPYPQESRRGQMTEQPHDMLSVRAGLPASAPQAADEVASDQPLQRPASTYTNPGHDTPHSRLTPLYHTQSHASAGGRTTSAHAIVSHPPGYLGGSSFHPTEGRGGEGIIEHPPKGAQDDSVGAGTGAGESASRATTYPQLYPPIGPTAPSTVFAPSINSNFTHPEANHNQEWFLPSEWDPTTSGLPDSSDPSAWQTLLGMDWSLTDLESGEGAIVGPEGIWQNAAFVQDEAEPQG